MAGEGPIKYRCGNPLELALRILETTTRAGLAVLLAFDHAGIPREIAFGAQALLERSIIKEQRAGDAHADGFGLAGCAAAVDFGEDIERGGKLHKAQRAGDSRALNLIREKVFEFPAVDDDVSGTRAQWRCCRCTTTAR